MKLQRQLLRKIGYAAAVGICIFLLFFVIGVTWIGFDVKSQCQQAQSEYGGDCTEALISLLQDENRGFRVRNDAIWALGQLGDSRARGGFAGPVHRQHSAEGATGRRHQPVRAAQGRRSDERRPKLPGHLLAPRHRRTCKLTLTLARCVKGRSLNVAFTMRRHTGLSRLRRRHSRSGQVRGIRRQARLSKLTSAVGATLCRKIACPAI